MAAKLHPRRLLHRLVRNEAGGDAIEFALVLPILLGIFFGIIEFGQVLWVQGTLDFAVQAAARCWTVNSTTCGTAAETETYASGETGPLAIPAADFTASQPSCGNQVTASYAFSFVGTFDLIEGSALLPTSVTLTASSCYPS